MPIYEYQCQACGECCDFLQKMSDDPQVTCPNCQKDKLQKQLSSPAFHLKGSGWYVTDFRDKKKSKETETKQAKPSDKKETKTTASKPAKKDK